MISELIAYILSLWLAFTPVPPGLYRVAKVVDGDTIKVSIDNKTETIRLIGVDTPETVDTRRAVGCFGKEASDFTKRTLFNQNVKLESDVLSGDRDKYQRLLRYVFLEDGQNFNQVLIENGYGHEYTYNSIPYKYQKIFKLAQIDARDNYRGLWAKGVCDKIN